MPTVIDSLVLSLELDSSKLTQEQREAIANLRRFESEAERTGRAIERQTGRTVSSFADLKRTVLGVFAAWGGYEAARLINNISTMDAAVGRNAKTLDMSVRDLSAWQGAAEAVGGSAAGITGAMQGTTGALNTFLLTGQASFLPVLNRLGISLFNQNHQLKTASELYLDLAQAMQGVDPARARALLSMIPGMNEESINLILRGRAELSGLVQDMRNAGTATEESAKAAAEYQKNLTLLERAATNLGRALVNSIAKPLAAAMTAITQYMQTTHDAIPDTGDFMAPASAAAPAPGAAARGALAARLRAGGAAQDHEAYIRAQAIAMGIDPNVAVAVARSEGLGGNYVGDRGSSFGDFQLHMGGLAGGGMATGGLGDEFQRKTGLDPRDPATWKQQIDFALAYAKAHGWGPWHGWKGLPFAGIGPTPGAGVAAAATVNNRGGDTTTNTTTIGSMIIHAEGGDSNEIASNTGAAMRRQNLAAPMDTSQY